MLRVGLVLEIGGSMVGYLVVDMLFVLERVERLQYKLKQRLQVLLHSRRTNDQYRRAKKSQYNKKVSTALVVHNSAVVLQ